MKRRLKLFGQSSYDRYLDILLQMWPKITDEYPNATLDICYGWDLFDKANHNNPERMGWKRDIQRLMKQPGITHHGRVGQKKLREVRKECGILAYPTYFPEIYMIGAVEAQHDGLVVVATDKAALSETANEGILIAGDIRDNEIKKLYLKRLLELMGDEIQWEVLSRKAQKSAKRHSWNNVADRWTKYLYPEMEEDVKVTVFTPTIRGGFWNMMADTLSKQTYSNFEWLIVDDYKKDRSDIAKKYADKYNLDIRYIQNDKNDRKYNLVKANNTGWKEADGDLFVFLQDFILIQKNGLEELVREHKRHPDALIAPVDRYYHSAVEIDKNNKEDWFDGKTGDDIVGEFIRENIRIDGNISIRETENPPDFEANYGAIPMDIIKELNGWWEFYDNGIGFDNTEIAFRALQLNKKIIIDESNIATCIDHWETVGAIEQGRDRRRDLVDYIYQFMTESTLKGDLPIVRDEGLDKKIKVGINKPSKEDVPTKEYADWMQENSKRLATNIYRKNKKELEK